MLEPKTVKRVNADLSLEIAGRQKPVRLLGIVAKGKAGAAALKAWLEDAAEVRLVKEGSHAGVYVEYVAWQDKSGSVWFDAGHMLISEGHAVVDEKSAFARKHDYQQTQRRQEAGTMPRYPNQ